jgi:hypothetical protein
MFEGANILARGEDQASPEGVGMTERELDEPVADVVEQHQEVVPDEDEPDETEADEVPLEANEADVAEQARTVRLSDDDYR